MQQSEQTYEQEVNDHIASVRANILKIIHLLYDRGDTHDASKLQSPEREVFQEQ